MKNLETDLELSKKTNKKRNNRLLKYFIKDKRKYISKYIFKNPIQLSNNKNRNSKRYIIDYKNGKFVNGIIIKGHYFNIKELFDYIYFYNENGLKKKIQKQKNKKIRQQHKKYINNYLKTYKKNDYIEDNIYNSINIYELEFMLKENFFNKYETIKIKKNINYDIC